MIFLFDWSSIPQPFYCSLKPKEEKKELVIPLIESNRWRHAKKPEDLEKTKNDQKKNSDTTTKEDKRENDVDSLAVEELLQGMFQF